jgi:hypothetical protein
MVPIFSVAGRDDTARPHRKGKLEQVHMFERVLQNFGEKLLVKIS